MRKVFLLSLTTLLLISCSGKKKFNTPLNENTDQKILSKIVSDTEQFKVKNIKNIIVIIGDGMGPNSIKAGEYFENKTYSFTKWQHTTSNTDSIEPEKKNKYGTTDSAAGGTAISTGHLTVNRIIGKDRNLNNLESITELAKKYGKATGVVTTDTLNGATPASFTAHADDRGLTEDIIRSQYSNEAINLLVGSYFSEYTNKKDKFIENGFSYSEDLDDSLLSTEKLIVNNINMCPYGETNNLTDSTKYAVNYLDKFKNGFTLMIEQAHIDKYSHKNDFDGMVHSVMELNRTIEFLSIYFKDRNDTMIFITADHETGKLKISNKGNLKNKINLPNGKMSYKYKKTGHSDTPVPLYIYGPTINFNQFTAFKSKHIVKNCEIGFLTKLILRQSNI